MNNEILPDSTLACLSDLAEPVFVTTGEVPSDQFACSKASNDGQKSNLYS